jgi:hypothetical protein
LDSLTVLVISSRFLHAAALNAPTEDSAMTNQLGRASAPPSSVDLCRLEKRRAAGVQNI